MEKKEEKRQNKKSVCDAIFCKDNLLRDIVIVAIAVGLSVLLIMNHRKLSYKQADEFFHPKTGECSGNVFQL